MIYDCVTGDKCVLETRRVADEPVAGHARRVDLSTFPEHFLEGRGRIERATTALAG